MPPAGDGPCTGDGCIGVYLPVAVGGLGFAVMGSSSKKLDVLAEAFAEGCTPLAAPRVFPEAPEN